MSAIIEIDRLVKRYGRTPAVEGVSLSVEEGEAFGYLGPNGSGKTTTIRCLLGLIRPTEGSLRVAGRNVSDDLPAILADVGHLPGEFGLWPQLTGRQSLEFLGALHPRPPVRRRELCERFDLSDAALDRPVRFYSRGMKQKIGIIQAFQHVPPVVVLDEPTEGLDPVMKDRFVRLLEDHRREGGTIFLSSHILSEVEAATERVGVLREGKLVRVGPTQDLTGERVRYCTLTLKAEVDPTVLTSVPGVSAVHGDHQSFRFEFRGDMEPLMRAIGKLPVREFLAEPERLTEAFFDVYGGEPE